MTFNREDPARLTAVGATELERRLLDAAAGEQPSPELTRRMRAALGLPIAGAAATAAVVAGAHAGSSGAAAAPVVGKAAATKVAVWIAAGVLSAGALGGLVGVWLSSRAPATTAPAIARPVPTSEPAPAEEDTAPSATTASRRPAHSSGPVVARHRAPAPAPATAADLRGEIALVDAARAAARTGAPDEALSLIRRYRAAYPAGTFRPEAAALEIEALAANGQPEKAGTLARQFLARNPDSPLAARVARFANDGSP